MGEGQQGLRLPGEGWPGLLPLGSEVRADKVSYASEQYGERGDVAG